MHEMSMRESNEQTHRNETHGDDARRRSRWVACSASVAPVVGARCFGRGRSALASLAVAGAFLLCAPSPAVSAPPEQAPQVVSALFVRGTIEVRWQLPSASDDGWDRDNYSVRWRRAAVNGSPPGQYESVVVAVPWWRVWFGYTQVQYNILSLDRRSAYDVGVAKVNSDGTGPWTTRVVRPLSLDEPSKVKLKAGDRQISVSWAPPVSPPASRASFEVINYCVRWRVAGGGSWNNFGQGVEVGPSASSYVISGLTNGTEYEVQTLVVRAEVSAGPWTKLLSATPKGAVAPTSNADTSLAALGLSGGGALSPSFSPEQTSYTATMRVTARTITVRPTARDQNARITVDGESVSSGQPSQGIRLLINQPRTIQVVVAAPTGTTGGQATSGARTVYTVVATRTSLQSYRLGRPRNVGLDPGDRTIGVTWSPPTLNRANSILGYSVRWRATGSSGQWNNFGLGVDVDATAASYTITGLTNGVEYDVEVSAVNEYFYGRWSSTRSATPTAPGTVDTLLSALSLSRGALEPSFASGRTSYVATIPLRFSSITVRPTARGQNVRITVDGESVISGQSSRGIDLEVNEPRTIEVVVAPVGSGSNGGQSQSSSQIVSDSPAADGGQGTSGSGQTVYTVVATRTRSPNYELGVPQSISLQPGDQTIKVSWSPPTLNRANSITDYCVAWRVAGSGPQGWNNRGNGVEVGGPDVRSYTITGLTNGVQYDVQMLAVNEYYEGPWSRPQSATPRAPDTLLSALVLSQGTLEPSFASGHMSYTVSIPLSASAITVQPTARGQNVRITVRALDANGSAVSSESVASGQSSQSIAIPRRWRADPRTIEVVVAAAGSGGAQSVYTVTTTRPRSVDSGLGTPRNISLAPGDQTIKVTWSPPLNRAGSVTNYCIRWRVAGSGRRGWNGFGNGVEASGLDYTITGLTNGVEYDVQMLTLSGYYSRSPWSPTQSATPTAAPSAVDTLLSALSLSRGTLEPSFASGRMSYAVTVPLSASTITVRPTARSQNVRITVDGKSVTSGQPSQGIALPVNRRRTIEVVVAPVGSNDGQSGSQIVSQSGSQIVSDSPVANGGQGTTGGSRSVYTVVVTRARSSAYSSEMPQGVSLVPGDQTIKVTWSPPLNRATIVDYCVRWRVTGTGIWGWNGFGSGVELGGPDFRSYTITGLTNGVQYDVQMLAVNEYYPGPWSPTQTATPTAPDTTTADTLLSALGLSGGVLSPSFSPEHMSYTATLPFSTSVVALRPTARDQNARITVNGQSVASGSLSQNIDLWQTWPRRLVLGNWPRTIEVAVAAPSGSARSVYTVVATSLVSQDYALGAPQDVSLVPGDRTIKVSWSPPTLNRANSITNYCVRWRVADGGRWNGVGGGVVESGGPDATTYTITGLTNGVEYDVQVQTINNHFASDWSPTQSATPTAPDTLLSALGLSEEGVLSPSFSPEHMSYTATLPYNIPVVALRPTARDQNARITVNGQSVVSGELSQNIDLWQARPRPTTRNWPRTIEVVVTVPGSSARSVYTVVATSLFSWDYALGVPQDVNLEPGDQTIGVTWSPPTLNRADSIVYYCVRWRVTGSGRQGWNNRGNGVEFGPEVRSHTITGLTNGVEYDVQVLVLNKYYQSPWSPTQTATPMGPDALLSALDLSEGTLEPSFASRHMSYTTTLPLSASIITVTPTARNQNARITVDGQSVVSGQASQDIAFRVNQPRTIEVAVTAPSGSVRGVYTVVATRLRSSSYKLGPPRDVSLTPGNQRIRVAWSPPALNVADSIRNYHVRWRQAGEGGVWNNGGDGVKLGASSTSSSYAYAITGLTNDVEYDVQVQARNDYYHGPWSPVQSATPAVPFDTSLSALGLSDGTLEPSFSSGRLSYTVSLSFRTTAVRLRPTAREQSARITVDGESVVSGRFSQDIALPANQAQTIEVAVAAPSGSPQSVYTVVATRLSVVATRRHALKYELGPPQNLRLEPGDQTIKATWSPPTLNRADSITNYCVRWRVSDGGDWNNRGAGVESGGPDATSYTITGLTNGVEYDVQVQTVNYWFASYWSPTQSATPMAPFDTLLSALALSEGALEPSFASEGMSYTTTVPLRASVITVTPTAREQNARITVGGESVVSGQSSQDIALQVNQARTIEVAVANPADSSQKSTYTVVATRLHSSSYKLGPPQNVSLTPSDQTIQVTWSPPTLNLADSIRDYRVRWRTAGEGGVWNNGGNGVRLSAAPASSSYTYAITGLTNDVEYDVQVQARNDHYHGPWSPTQSATPAAPFDILLSALALSEGALEPSFASEGMSYTTTVPLRASVITVTPTAREQNARITVGGESVVSGQSSQDIALQVNQARTIEVAVANPADSSQKSVYTVVATRLRSSNYELGPPQNVSLLPSNRRIRVTWSPPTLNRADSIRSYHVRWRQAGEGGVWNNDGNGVRLGASSASSSYAYAITGLTNDVEYDVQVQARNDYYHGPWSPTQSATPVANLRVRLIYQDHPGTQLRFSWFVPEGESLVDEVEYKRAADTVWQRGGSTRGTHDTAYLDGLTPDTYYDVRVPLRKLGSDSPYRIVSGRSKTFLPFGDPVLADEAPDAFGADGQQGGDDDAPGFRFTFTHPDKGDFVARNGFSENNFSYKIGYRVPGALSFTYPGNTVVDPTASLISGLNPGAEYEMRLTARYGSSKRVETHADFRGATPTQACVTAGDANCVPGAPPVGAAQPAATSIKLQWLPPSYTGAYAGDKPDIIGYTVSYRAPAETTYRVVDRTGRATTASETINGLSPGTEYVVTVAAVNNVNNTVGLAAMQTVSTLALLDVDGDGQAQREDGLLTARYLMGARGARLTSGLTDAPPAEVERNVSSGASGSALDVNGDGQVGVADGILIYRCIAGATEGDLTGGLTGEDVETVESRVTTAMGAGTP